MNNNNTIINTTSIDDGTVDGTQQQHDDPNTNTNREDAPLIIETHANINDNDNANDNDNSNANANADHYSDSEDNLNNNHNNNNDNSNDNSNNNFNYNNDNNYNNDVEDEEKQSLLNVLETLKGRVQDLENKTTYTKTAIQQAQDRAMNNNGDETASNQEVSCDEPLDDDVFALMVLNEPFTASWNFGLFTFILQMLLLVFIFQGFEWNLPQTFETSLKGIPFHVPIDARIAQVLAIIVSIMLSTDVVMPVKELSMLWITNEEAWLRVIYFIDGNSRNYSLRLPSINSLRLLSSTRSTLRRTWIIRILLPNALKFTEGVVVLSISFLIIIRNNETIQLFKDFAAMTVVSQIDNLAFWLADMGYFGSELKYNTEQSKQVKVKEEYGEPTIHICGMKLPVSIRPFLLSIILFIMIGSFIPIIVMQENGHYFKKEYPYCLIGHDKIPLIGNGECDGGIYNSWQCGSDGGDCTEFNWAYPTCDASDPSKVGDLICNNDTEYNVEECGYDGGDCCSVINSTLLNDKTCHGGDFNNERCGYDSGDCAKFRDEYPNCKEDEYNITDKNGNPIAIGNGICDLTATYLITPECGYSYGDCVGCSVDDHTKLNNGLCDGGKYNVEACKFDNNDCDMCNAEIEEKGLDLSKIGNDICDGKEYALIDACNLDGGDCTNCNVSDYFLIGNGICNGGEYMSEECSYDGGDCTNCTVDDNSLVGDGTCNGGDYMTSECSYDGGDCALCNVVDNSLVGDGTCNGGDYNSQGCSDDGGDCMECNALLLDRKLDKSLLGNGICNGGFYMSSECGSDGGDCDKCNVKEPLRIGDGNCDVEYNTDDCSHDGGDCLVPDYPDCYVDDPNKIGDGICHGGNYTTKLCGEDGGDCEEFNQNYPNCLVSDPTRIQNEECDKDGFEYNIASCNFDGGDCTSANENITSTYPNCAYEAPVEVGWIGNGFCNKELNVEECGFDDGDCEEYNKRYPNCTAPNPWMLFDSTCDGILPYNSADCGYDGGACNDINAQMKVNYPECLNTLIEKKIDPDKFGYLANDRCDIELNIDECGFDDNKCKEFKELYPGCIGQYTIEPWRIGDGHCDFKPGQLNKKNHNVELCGYDGGDCKEYNEEMREKYPDCEVEKPWFVLMNDTKCSPQLNLEECGFDGGDCKTYNEGLRKENPDCNVTDAFLFRNNKDHVCNPQLNSTECGFDGGDCEKFKKRYPECSAANPQKIGDGECDEEYNTKECNYDGEDCL